MLRALGGGLLRALRGSSSSSSGASGLPASSRLLAGPAHHDDDDHHDEDPHHGHTPTVFDALVTINVVDLNGKRRSVKGVAGMSLAQVLVEAGYPKVRRRGRSVAGRA